MDESTNREKVLKRLRSALLHKTSNPFPGLVFEKTVFHPNDPLPEITFAEKFEAAGGKFLLCETEIELAEDIISICRQNKWADVYCTDSSLSSLLDSLSFNHQSIYDSSEDINLPAAVVTCDLAIAATGSLVFSSLIKKQLLLASASQNLLVVVQHIAEDLKSGLNMLKQKNNNKLPAEVWLLSGNGNYENNKNLKTHLKLFALINILPD